MTATTDGTLAIGAPMTNWDSEEEEDADEDFSWPGDGSRGIPGGEAGDIFGWGWGREWGDGAVYIIHAGY